MNIESKKLQEFLNINISHRLPYLKHPIFSENSKQLLVNIINNLCSYDKEFDYSKITIHHIDDSYIPKGIHYELCPNNIKKYMNNINTTGKSFYFSIGERKFKIYLIYEYSHDNNPYFKKFFYNAIHHIYLLIPNNLC